MPISRLSPLAYIPAQPSLCYKCRHYEWAITDWLTPSGERDPQWLHECYGGGTPGDDVQECERFDKNELVQSRQPRP
jgi:hypothetical protein